MAAVTILASDQLRALARLRQVPAIAAYPRRFGKAASDLYHVLRALTYFDDAERESPKPVGLSDEHWRTIRDYFEREAPAALRRMSAEPTS